MTAPSDWQHTGHSARDRTAGAERGRMCLMKNTHLQLWQPARPLGTESCLKRRQHVDWLNRALRPGGFSNHIHDLRSLYRKRNVICWHLKWRTLSDRFVDPLMKYHNYPLSSYANMTFAAYIVVSLGWQSFGANKGGNYSAISLIKCLDLMKAKSKWRRQMWSTVDFAP